MLTYTIMRLGNRHYSTSSSYFKVGVGLIAVLTLVFIFTFMSESSQYQVTWLDRLRYPSLHQFTLLDEIEGALWIEKITVGDLPRYYKALEVPPEFLSLLTTLYEPFRNKFDTDDDYKLADQAIQGDLGGDLRRHILRFQLTRRGMWKRTESPLIAKVSWLIHRTSEIEKLLSKSVRRVSNAGLPFPEVDLFFNINDCVATWDCTHPTFDRMHCPTPRQLPLMGAVHCQGSAELPFPIWDQANGRLAEWDAYTATDVLPDPPILWERKISKAVFRGGIRSCQDLADNEGHHGVPRMWNDENMFKGGSDDWKKCGRMQLVIRQKEYPDLLDVAITDSRVAEDEFPNSSPLYMSMQEQQRFKYIIYAEGHCGWANRLRHLLFSSSAVILQQTPCIEYYGMMLEPYVHYIPVNYHFTDLAEKIRWGNDNDDKVKEIVRNANAFAARVLSQRSTEIFAAALLVTHAAHQSNIVHDIDV